MLHRISLSNERQEKFKQLRIARLLTDATKFGQAEDIRAYVADLSASLSVNADPTISCKLEALRSWALTQADMIDPAKSGAFLEALNKHES